MRSPLSRTTIRYAAKLYADAPVIGVTFNDVKPPIYLLNGHEIVNDVVGGLNIVVVQNGYRVSS